MQNQYRVYIPYKRNGHLKIWDKKVVTKFRKSTEILGTLLELMPIASVMSTSVNYSLTPPPHATDKPTELLLRKSGPSLL